MIRFFTMLACICLLLQLVINQVHDDEASQPSQYVIVGLAYVAPLFSLIALVRKPRRGLLSDVIERKRVRRP